MLMLIVCSAVAPVTSRQGYSRIRRNRCPGGKAWVEWYSRSRLVKPEPARAVRLLHPHEQARDLRVNNA